MSAVVAAYCDPFEMEKILSLLRQFTVKRTAFNGTDRRRHGGL